MYVQTSLWLYHLLSIVSHAMSQVNCILLVVYAINLEYEDSEICVKILQAKLSILKDREQFKSVQLVLLVAESESI